MQELSPSIQKLIAESLTIEISSAQERGALGFMARALTQASLPYTQVEGAEFERRNGAFTLSLTAPSRVGLPYGSIPRLLIAWLTTEAVRKRERELVLGDSLSDFMRQLDMVPTGGRWGSITRLKGQTKRLFAASVSCIYEGSDHDELMGFRVADKASMWWDPKSPDQAGLWKSTVTLSEPFFRELIEHPVPVDMDALKALKKSPMALDIYTWMTYRMSYLGTPVTIPWPLLEMQFGANYKRTRAFREAFLRAMKKVAEVYPEANIDSDRKGLTLKPSRPHIQLSKG